AAAAGGPGPARRRPGVPGGAPRGDRRVHPALARPRRRRLPILARGLSPARRRRAHRLLTARPTAAPLTPPAALGGRPPGSPARSRFQPMSGLHASLLTGVLLWKGPGYLLRLPAGEGSVATCPRRPGGHPATVSSRC